MALWDAIVGSAKAGFDSAKSAVNEAADPRNMAPETKAVVDTVSKVTDGMANALQSAKDLYSKLGVKAPLSTTEDEVFSPSVPTARLAAEALSKARVSSIAEMTKNGSPAANTGSATYWRDRFGKGAQIATENSAAPQGALPPG